MSLVHELLEEATKASSGTQRFIFIVGSTVRIAQIAIPGDADKLNSIKSLAQTYTRMEESPVLPGGWAGLIGDGVSDNIANRIAYAQTCQLSVFPVGTSLVDEPGKTVVEPAGAQCEAVPPVELLKLARNAGGLFNFLTDEIIRRVNGINFDIEQQVVQKLGEGSPATTGD